MAATKQQAEQNAVGLTVNNLTPKERLIVALDVPTLADARVLMAELASEVGMFKAGLELFSACGTDLFKAAEEAGAKLFFDCKLYDIPNTVAGACRAVVANGPALFNLHALGGSKMMKAAVAARDEAYAELQKSQGENIKAKPTLIAVTILTSMNAEVLSNELKVAMPLTEMVLHLAKMTKECGLDGVVASALEASVIRQALGPDFLIITPGIRPSWAASDDQSRIVTPKDAIAGGANLIVVGRPITRAQDRVEAARKIVEELSG